MVMSGGLEGLQSPKESCHTYRYILKFFTYGAHRKKSLAMYSEL